MVNKTTFGAFTSTGLDHVLRSLGMTSLVVGGILTNVCVETRAREAADRGYEVVLRWMPRLLPQFGRVRKTDEVLALLKCRKVSGIV